MWSLSTLYSESVKLMKSHFVCEWY